tara:strand:- start:78 stop:584 length:507 start_codon:yes stop_codon:yes gene_type:complete
MAEWNTYIEQITSKYDFETNAVTLGNVCDAAAIYGNDGSCWAYSANFPELTSYQFVVEGMTESENQTVDVNEVDAATKVANGDRKPSGAAGIRLGNAKYMFIAHDETTKTTQCSKQGGGGAALANLKDATIIAFWDKTKAMSNGQPQVSAQCAEQVAVMRAFLTESGY